MIMKFRKYTYMNTKNIENLIFMHEKPKKSKRKNNLLCQNKNNKSK